MDIAIDFILKQWAAADAERDRGLTEPEDVLACKDIAYGPDGEWNLLDAYLPRDAQGPVPVFVNVHGGGYCYGSKELYRFYCMDLARRGVGVVSMNYHLAPGFTYPAPLRDIDLALGWLARDGEKHGFDLQRVYLVGDSAGAQLVSQYAAAWSDRGYAAELGLTPPDLPIRGVGLNCGMYDVSARANGDPNPLVNSYYKGELPGLDVLDHIGPGYPPAYLMSAPGDFLLDHCEPMCELLRSRGVDAAFRIYGDKGVKHVFQLDIRSEVARQASDDELAWLLAH